MIYATTLRGEANTMDRIKKLYTQTRLAFSKSGMGYIISRLPSIVFWSTVSTGLLIGGQFLYFDLLPGNYFFSYKSPAHVSNVELGKTPVLDYCRMSNDTYPVVINAQVRKVEPPVYTQQYQVTSSLPEGSGCVSREVAVKPAAPGDYKIFYTVKVTLPFGVEKYATFETDPFTVSPPKNLYGDYSLTVKEDVAAPYVAGKNITYAFKGFAVVEYFGTTERHLICSNKDYFIDSYSGRTTDGEKDSVNSTVTIPDGVSGQCSLELRITGTVGDAKTAVTQVLRSNSFSVQ